MISPTPLPTSRYVMLQGIQHGNRFFSSYIQGEDATKSAKGETWYIVLGYTDTMAEVQEHLYGFVSTTRID